MSDSMQMLAPTLLMVALLSLVIVGLLIYVRASRAMQRERDEQRRVQTRLTVEKQEAEGRSVSLTHGLNSTSQACRQAVQQLPLADDAKSLALGLMALLPKLPVPVDNAAPYRQSLKGHALELDRLELLVATVNNAEVTRRWVHGSYQDLCEIPSLLLPAEDAAAQSPKDSREVIVALAAVHAAAPDDDKAGLRHPVQRPGWVDDN